MSYNPEQYGHITDKVKVLLDLSKYTNKNELDDGAGVENLI